MKKRVLSILLAIVLMLSSMPLALADSTNNYKIDWLVQNGIVKGRNGGDLALQKNITRAEFARMVLASTGELEAAEAYAGASTFKDISSDHWAQKIIAYATLKGYLAGYTDGTFRPDAFIKQVECIAILVRLSPNYVEPQVKPAYWAQAYIDYAKTSGLLHGIDSTKNLEKFAVRQTAFELTYNEVQVKTTAKLNEEQEARKILEEETARKEAEAMEEAKKEEARKESKARERRERRDRYEIPEIYPREIEYRINFDANGGLGYMPTDYILGEGYYTLPACSYKAPKGFHFDGWSINGSKYKEVETVYVDRDIYVSATWAKNDTEPVTPKTYKVTATKATANPTEAEEGAEVTITANAAEEGQEFLGWEVTGIELAEEQKTKKEITIKMPANNVTITATYKAKTVVPPTPKTYKVTATKATANPTEAEEGAEVTITANAAEEGQEFLGWEVTGIELAEEQKTKKEITIKMPANNVTITATYKAKTVVPPTPKTYKVTATKATANPTEAEEGAEVTITANAAEEGQEFLGWEVTGIELAEEQKTKKEITIKMPANNVTITATYKAKTVVPPTPNTYTITATNATATKTTAAKGDEVKITANAAEEGQEFDKWEVIGIELAEEQKTSKEITIKMPANNVTIKATYKAKEYTVKFDLQGKTTTAIAEQKIKYNQKATAPTAPTAEGYEFKGWYTEADCTNEYKFAETPVTDNITLYAKWEAKEYTVKFDLQGKEASAIPEQKIKYNQKATAPAAPTAEGYEFKGWYTEADCTNEYKFAETPVTGNITLYAKWEAKKYTVSFDLKGHGEAIEAKEVKHGEKVTAPTAPTAEGYEFKGWYKESEYKNEYKFAEEKVTDNITLYAKWEAKEYTITVTGAKIKIAGVEASTDTAKAAKDTQITITANDAAERKVFVGWEVEGIELKEDQKVSNQITFKMPEKDITIKAAFADLVEENAFIDALIGEAKTLNDTKKAVRLNRVMDNNALDEYANKVLAEFNKRIDGTYLKSIIRSINIGAGAILSKESTIFIANLNIGYNHTKEQEAEVDKYVSKVKEEINGTLNTSGLSEDKVTYEKIKAVHDYIITNAAYFKLTSSTDKIKVEEVQAGDEKFNTVNGVSVHSPYVLCHEDNTLNIGVCQAYAGLFQKFMDKMGITCYFATGYAGEKHAWNIVKIGEKYYNIDLTFDDPVDSTGKQQEPKSRIENYEYFLRGDKFFKNPGEYGIPHTRDNLKDISVEENDYDGRADGNLDNTQNSNQTNLDTAA